MKLSKNFRSEEFSCRCGSCPGSEDPPMKVAFIMKLQKMRNLYSKPIRVMSGYRCPNHNRNVRGNPSSQHLQGNASDLLALSASDKFWLVRYAIESGFAGIGVGRDFIHVDDREGAPVMWTY